MYNVYLDSKPGVSHNLSIKHVPTGAMARVHWSMHSEYAVRDEGFPNQEFEFIQKIRNCSLTIVDQHRAIKAHFSTDN